MSSYFCKKNGKTIYSGLKCCRHSHSSVCSLFPHTFNFELSQLFPNIWPCHTFTGLIYFLSWCHDSALSCILFTWYEHILSFPCIYFEMVSLPAKNIALTFFLVICMSQPRKLSLTWQIIIISIGPKQICTTQFQTLLVCLTLQNGIGLLLEIFFLS